MNRQLLLATNNVKKLAELRRMLAEQGLAIDVLALADVADFPEPVETEWTFEGNALTKARAGVQHSGLPTLADDSGLCVQALGGAPGVFSARYAGEPKSDERNTRKLVADLAGKSDRRAHYVCVLVFVRHADDPQPVIAEGEWHGEIVDAPRGNGGFGYDPYFFLPAAGVTAAELDAAEKNRCSHRGQALAQLVERLKTRRA